MSTAAETEAAAARWLARRTGDVWSDSDQAALDAWLGQSTSNRVAYLRLQAAWTKADRLRAVQPPSDLPFEAPEAVADGRGQPPRWRQWWPAAAAAALVAIMAVPTARALWPATQSYSTPVGGFQRLPLEDGSRVELNTDTQLNVAYTPTERAVELTKGEAFFKVAKNAKRPFVVVAGDYRVVAVGTAFRVRLRGTDVDVLVTEGTVRIEGPSKSDGGRPTPALASAGQAASLSEASTVVRPAPEQALESALGWRDGLLVFDGRPLGEVAAEFNRYNARKLVVDASATDVMVDGAFRATNVDGFVRLLPEGFGVEGVPDGRDEIVLKKIRR